MATTSKHAKGMASERYAELKRMLEDRRREIMSEVQGKIRDVRTESGKGKMNEVFDAGESSEADIQEDIEFALIQMKAETLNKINEALARLEEGRLRQLLRVRRGNRASSACGRCPSPSAARTARRRARTRSQRERLHVAAVVVAVLRHVQLTAAFFTRVAAGGRDPRPVPSPDSDSASLSAGSRRGRARCATCRAG